MMNCIPSQSNFGNPQEIADYRTYIMYRNGLYKTARRGEAIELLKSGWYDKTKYKPNDEVLTYEIQTKCVANEKWFGTRPTGTSNADFDSSERQHEEISSGSISCGDGKKSGHQQYQSNSSNETREEHLLQTIRSGSQCSEIKKRGRPKKVK